MEGKGRQLSKYEKEELPDRQRRAQVDLGVWGCDALRGSSVEASRARAGALPLGRKAAGDAHSLAVQLDWETFQGCHAGTP